MTLKNTLSRLGPRASELMFNAKQNKPSDDTSSSPETGRDGTGSVDGRAGYLVHKGTNFNFFQHIDHYRPLHHALTIDKNNGPSDEPVELSRVEL